MSGVINFMENFELDRCCFLEELESRQNDHCQSDVFESHLPPHKSSDQALLNVLTAQGKT